MTTRSYLRLSLDAPESCLRFFFERVLAALGVNLRACSEVDRVMPLRTVLEPAGLVFTSFALLTLMLVYLREGL